MKEKVPRSPGAPHSHPAHSLRVWSRGFFTRLGAVRGQLEGVVQLRLAQSSTGSELLILGFFVFPMNQVVFFFLVTDDASLLKIFRSLLNYNKGQGKRNSARCPLAARGTARGTLPKIVEGFLPAC